jgi:hypothetical protein
VEIMSKIYRYIHFRDDGYSKGFESVEEALADARKRYSAEEKVYIGEDEEYVPAVWYDRVIKNLQCAVDIACTGYYGEYDEVVPDEARESLYDALTDALVKWAKEHGIKNWIYVPTGKKDVLYDLQTGKPVEEESK